MSAHGWRRFHIAMIFVWIALLLPTILWWKDSILWVSLMSVYAIVAAHWAAYQSTRIEDKEST